MDQDEIAARHEKIMDELRQMKADADHWNAMHPDEEPIVIDLNLQPDIDREIARRKAAAK